MIWLRWLCFLSCIPSGGALLLKVWGITSMARGGLLFLACLPILVLGYRVDSELAGDIRRGCWGGVLGTLGYDLVRVPFHLAGFRVFAPIQAYGVWLLDADRSSAATEMLGWLYHFSNGISFGIMYALWMGRKHWAWALLWGLSLEAIVLSTPFARIFHMQGNVQAIAIAYAAHLAYGFPLGWVVARRPRVSAAALSLAGLLVATFVLAGVPGERERAARALAGTLRVEGIRLNPTWLRLPAPGRVTVSNPGAQPVTLVEPAARRELVVAGSSNASWEFPKPGIYQCYIKSGVRSISSFVIVEPVEQK